MQKNKFSIVDFIGKNLITILFTLIVLVIVIILFSMFYNYLGDKIAREVEKKMNLQELSVYDFRATHAIRQIDGYDVPELTLTWKTTNPSLTIYDITSDAVSRSFSNKEYKTEHIVTVILNKESIPSTLKVTLTARDAVQKEQKVEFYYYIKEIAPDVSIQ
jgi:hypothetical protein